MKRVVTILLVAGLAATAGCQKQTTGSAAAPAASTPEVTADINPLLEKYDIRRVGILDVANTSSERDAEQVKTFVEGALLRSGKYEFAKSSAFKRDAARSGVEAEFDRLQESWEKALKLDDINVKAVCEATGKDAILAYEVPTWQEMKVNAYTTGYSTTTVRLHMVLYAADGTMVWEVSDQKVKESNYYDPSLYVKSTQSGQAVYDESKVPDAPPIEPVAQQLADELVQQIPKVEPKDEAAEESGGGW